MKKNTIIYIAAGILVLIIIGLSIFFIISNNNSNKKNVYYTKKVTLSRLENDEPVKTVEIKNTNLVKQLIKICNNISLEQDEKAQRLAIINDIKIDLNNGTVIYMQEGLDTYCYIENQDVNQVISMPAGLVDFINKNLSK